MNIANPSLAQSATGKTFKRMQRSHLQRVKAGALQHATAGLTNIPVMVGIGERHGPCSQGTHHILPRRIHSNDTGCPALFGGRGEALHSRAPPAHREATVLNAQTTILAKALAKPGVVPLFEQVLSLCPAKTREGKLHL